MTDDLAVRALDQDFVVRAPEPIAARLATMLEPLTVDRHDLDDDPESITIEDVGHGRWRLVADGIDTRSAPPGRVLAGLLEHVNARAAASLLVEVPLHAAAVRHPAGGCIVLVGASGAGKSTLGAAALRAGWGFVAEEIAAVDPHDLVVRRYHRPIGLRRGGASAIGVSYPDDDWYADVYPWPVPAAARSDGDHLLGAALVRRDDRNVVAELTPALALVELVEHTVIPVSNRIVPVFRLLDRLVRTVPVVRLSSAAPADTVDVLDELAARWRS